MKNSPPRPVQFFSDEYLERCRAMKPAEVLEFLESFRLLHGRASYAVCPELRHEATSLLDIFLCDDVRDLNSSQRFEDSVNFMKGSFLIRNKV